MIPDVSLSLFVRRKVLRGITVALVLSSAACAAERPPLVTESEGSWQHSYEVESGLVHEGVAPSKPTNKAPAHDEALEPQQPPPESFGEQVVHVCADVIAFPFRGVGWVVQKIF